MLFELTDAELDAVSGGRNSIRQYGRARGGDGGIAISAAVIVVDDGNNSGNATSGNATANGGSAAVSQTATIDN